MNRIEIAEVNSAKLLSDFLKLPARLFAEDPYWVSPLLSEQKAILDRKRNPFFRHCRYQAWVIYKDQKIQGRVLAYVDDAYNQHSNSQTGFIGFFDCTNNDGLAGSLFAKATHWLREEGMTHVYGPMNFSIGNECGVQLDAFDTMPYLQMNHMPPYYRTLFENAGFTKAHDLYAYKVNVAEVVSSPIFLRFQQVAERIKMKENITFRQVDMKNFNAEIELINNLFNQALRDNWGFVPSELEEALFVGKSLKMIVDPSLVLIAERNGKPIGMSISLPDANQVLKRMNGKLFPIGWLKFLLYRRNINRARVYILGILEEERMKGLDAVFYCTSLTRGKDRGYKEAELSWISEENEAMIRMVEKMGADRYKTYRMYRRQLI